MMQGKQAKIVSPIQERAILGYLVTTRYPARDRVMFLLSMKAGLRAKAMASLTWAVVTDAAGQVAEVLHVPNRASKGKTGGRTIPLHPDLQTALVTLQTARADMATPERPILFSERGGGLSPATVRLWFHRLYTSLKMDGCSSHSGRRTFITRAARRVSQIGGSLRDVQELAGHTSLAMKQRVAYLLAADIVSGPLPSRLREVNQPVIITRNRFSRPRPCPLVCICAH